MLANCLHDLAAIGPGGVPAVMAALFLAGLAGGFSHCVGMCAPFVLAQAGARANRDAAGGMVRRLAGAALLPYQLGRMLGYGLLGALAGGMAGAVTQVTGLRYLLAALLAVAALLMAAQALARLPAGWVPRLPSLPLAPQLVIGRWIAPLLADPTGPRGVALGLLLSALPCGLLYAALAAAAATGSALAGFLAMVAFVAGTAPALFGVALAGRFLLRRAGPWMRPAAAGLFALNGLMLGAMAVRLLA